RRNRQGGPGARRHAVRRSVAQGERGPAAERSLGRIRGRSLLSQIVSSRKRRRPLSGGAFLFGSCAPRQQESQGAGDHREQEQHRGGERRGPPPIEMSQSGSARRKTGTICDLNRGRGGVWSTHC